MFNVCYEMVIIFWNDRSIPDVYREKLESSGVLKREESELVIEKHSNWLAESLRQVDDYIPQPSYFTHRWMDMQQAPAAITTWDSGVDLDLFRFVTSKSVQLKNDLVSKILRNIDWNFRLELQNYLDV